MEDGPDLSRNGHQSRREVAQRARDEDSELLHSQVSANHQRNPRLTSHQEAHISQVLFEMLSQQSRDPASNAGIIDAFNAISNPRLRMVVLSDLFTNATSGPQASRREKENFVASLLAALDSKQQAEIGELLAGLPPGTMGDRLATEQSRVFIDAISDCRDSVREDKAKILSLGSGPGTGRKLIESLGEMLQQRLSDLPDLERTNVLLRILEEQEPPLKMKLVLQQIMLSNVLPADVSSREAFLQKAGVSTQIKFLSRDVSMERDSVM